MAPGERGAVVKGTLPHALVAVGVLVVAALVVVACVWLVSLLG